MLRDELADRGHVVVPADETRELGPQVGLLVLFPPPQLAPQQRDVQGRQLRRGVDAQRVGQRFPRALVTEQGLGVATGGHQGTHQRSNQPYPQRMRGRRVGQFRDYLHALAETDLRFEPIFHRRQAQPVEPGHRRLERFTVFQRDILHGRAAPQGEGFAQ
jgi:hypothetical protein